MHFSWYYLGIAYFIVGWIIRAAMVPVVLRRQLAPGASLGWLLIVAIHPYVGLTLYMLVGETRLGPHRVEQYRRMIAMSRHGAKKLQVGSLPGQMRAEYQAMGLQAQKISGMPVLPGNSVDFLGDAGKVLDRLVADIDSAGNSVDLLYYIFGCDATGRRVVDSLCKAQARGVECRVLVDAVASRDFFHRHGLARPLRAAGIKVVAALPAQLIRRRLPRVDLRNHRKLAVVDRKIGYCGSHNLIDADYGGRKGAPWVDVTGRFTGPIVDELSTIFAEDWAIETGGEFTGPAAYDVSDAEGEILMQVVPTGPTAPGDTYRRLLLAAIQSAQTRLTLTTPYFVPDETTLVAMMMAADRGVDVRLLLPENPDHFFTAAAGLAHFSRLMEAGVAIYLYRPGLLHAKTTTVDDEFCIFGSANLDVRSFNINFELSVLLYGREVTQRLRAVQEDFVAHSKKLDQKEWEKRPVLYQYGDGAVSLLSPLL